MSCDRAAEKQKEVLTKCGADVGGSAPRGGRKEYLEDTEKCREDAGKCFRNTRKCLQDAEKCREDEKCLGNIGKCLQDAEKCREGDEKCLGNNGKCLQDAEKCREDDEKCLGNTGRCLQDADKCREDDEKCIGNTGRCLQDARKCHEDAAMCREDAGMCREDYGKCQEDAQKCRQNDTFSNGLPLLRCDDESTPDGGLRYTDIAKCINGSFPTSTSNGFDIPKDCDGSNGCDGSNVSDGPNVSDGSNVSDAPNSSDAPNDQEPGSTEKSICSDESRRYTGPNYTQAHCRFEVNSDGGQTCATSLNSLANALTSVDPLRLASQPAFGDRPKPRSAPEADLEVASHCQSRASSLGEAGGGRPAEGGWGWMVVLGAAIVNMMFGINYRMFGLVYIEMRNRFHASSTASVWVGGVNILLGGFCGPLAAWLLSRYSHRAVTAVGATLAVIGMVGTGYVPSLPLAYVTYGLITGVGIALAHTSSVALVGHYFEKRKALALAIQSVTSGLSAVIFSPLMAIFFTEFSYPGTFVIFGGIFTHMYIASALFRPLEDGVTLKRVEKVYESNSVDVGGGKYAEYKPHASCHIDGDDGDNVEHSHMQDRKTLDNLNNVDLCGTCEEHSHRIPQAIDLQRSEDKVEEEEVSETVGRGRFLSCSCSYSARMRSPVFICFFFLLLSVTAGRAVTSAFLPALALELGTTLTEAALLPAVSGLAAAAGSLVVGAAFDTSLGRRHRVYLYSLNAFLIGAAMLGMPFAGTFTGLAAATAVNGVSSTVIFAQQMTVLTDLLGARRAVAGLGVVRVALALGSILGRSLSAIFVDTMQTNRIGFYATSSLPMLGSAVFVSVTFVHSRRKEAASRCCC